MDDLNAQTAGLLLNVAPDVFAGNVFALKGGTAINLFVRDMPRLSVDMDLVLVERRLTRDEAIALIKAEVRAIQRRLARQGLEVRLPPKSGPVESRIYIDQGSVQVVIDINNVFRGTVLPVDRRAITAAAAKAFRIEIDLPVLHGDELYGGKLVAAMDRQHPRDLFDVWQMYETCGLTDGMVECFVVYIAGHNRPTHEVLAPVAKDIDLDYFASFAGLTTVPIDLPTLLAVRSRLMHELPRRLLRRHREFLLSLVRAEPNWSLLECPHAEELPGLRWKLKNLELLRERQPEKFKLQSTALEAVFDAL